MMLESNLLRCSLRREMYETLENKYNSVTDAITRLDLDSFIKMDTLDDWEKQ